MYLKPIKMTCLHCGNKWLHHIGCGFDPHPIMGNIAENFTGDGDWEVRCPKCHSDHYSPKDIPYAGKGNILDVLLNK